MTKHALIRALSKVLNPTRTRASASIRSLCTSSSSDAPLKNVTKGNFEPALVELRRIVREADFVAIDLEMTGVTSAPWRECFEFDRPDIQYLKVRDSAEKFAVVQFGVCPFRWDSQKNVFVAHPHNFYIFPRQEISCDGMSPEFLCQTSSMGFLAKYQFDFNACINEGISYLSRSQEEEALRQLDLVYKDEMFDTSSSVRQVEDIELVKMADILFTERMKKQISEWRDGLLRCGGNDSQGNSGVMQKFQTTFFQKRPALTLPDLTSRQQKLIKQVTEKNFKDLIYIHHTAKTSGLHPLIVYTDSKADQNMLMKVVKANRWKEAETKIKGVVGFRHVIDLLSSERKLIVGHNCFLDLAHIHRKFIGPLPFNAEEFVFAVQKYFPYIVDTKVMLNSDIVLRSLMKRGSTSLSKAFDALRSQISINSAKSPSVEVEVQVDEQRFTNWNSGAKHEAGYDAFMTGSVFIQACCHLGIDFMSHPPLTDLLHHKNLQKYVNHLYLSWISKDIINLKTAKINTQSLSSIENKQLTPKINLPNMVLIWGLSPEVKTKNLKDCLGRVFHAKNVLAIYRIDETAVFIQFDKPEFVKKFWELKDLLESDRGPISVIHPLSKILESRLESGRVNAASYEVYKEICSSPMAELVFTDQVEAMGIKRKRKSSCVSVIEKCDQGKVDESESLEDSLDVVEEAQASR